VLYCVPALVAAFLTAPTAVLAASRIVSAALLTPPPIVSAALLTPAPIVSAALFTPPPIVVAALLTPAPTRPKNVDAFFSPSALLANDIYILANERRMISIKENIFLYRKLFFFTKSFRCPCPFLYT